ncbi:MAG TPA: hypothetical protein VMX35_00535 [Acidobacteriota bacterium]|nr:hypothetical protein [Acidobacteriota bacterium]
MKVDPLRAVRDLMEEHMSYNLIENLLGVSGTALPKVASRTGAYQAGGDKSFASALAEAAGGMASPNGTRRSISDIVLSSGGEFGDLINRMNAASTLDERLSLATDFRDRVVASLQAAGYSAQAGGEEDKIVTEGVTYDILRSINTLGAQTSVQLHVVGGGYNPSLASGGGWTGPASEVLFATARDRADLIDQINSASTVEERERLASEFRDAVITALRASGHTAEAVGGADKIVIDGQMYDILRDVKTVGRPTAVQMHWVGGTEGGNSSSPYVAILSAGLGAGASLLAQINGTSNLDQRKTLALELRQLVIDALKQSGFAVGEGYEADKIVVNGKTYDFIRSLFSPNETATLQALLVGSKETA